MHEYHLYILAGIVFAIMIGIWLAMGGKRLDGKK